MPIFGRKSAIFDDFSRKNVEKRISYGGRGLILVRGVFSLICPDNVETGRIGGTLINP